MPSASQARHPVRAPGSFKSSNDNTRDAPPPPATPPGISTERFLEITFGPGWRDVWLASFPGWNENWKGQRYAPGYVSPANNNYFAIGLMDPASNRRASDAVVSHHLFFADDVGTKVDPAKWDAMLAMGFPEPTFKIETSPGNETWIWVLDKPITLDEDESEDDTGRLRALRVVREALGRLGLSDPLPDDARYIRLPSGINGKPKYRNPDDGAAPRVSLVEWNAGQTADIEQCAAILAGPDWQDKDDDALGIKGGSSYAGALHRSADLNNPDPVIQLAFELGMNPVQVRAGVVEAECPFMDEHTTRVETGFAFLGNGLMECSHASCQNRRTPDFLRMMCETYDDRQDTKAALGLPLGGPATASEFLARATFEYHDRKAGSGVADLVEQAGQMAVAGAVRTAQHQAQQQAKLDQALEDLDRRFALVQSHSGVVDRLPGSSALYGVMGTQHFRNHFDGMMTERNRSGRLQGLGAFWIGRPETPRFERLGLWPVGEEPAEALNLFDGLPALSSRAERRDLPAGAQRSCARVLAFIREVICSGDAAQNDYALNWLAWVVQNPLEKPGVNLVLIGKQGTGKSTLGRMLLDIFGLRYSLHVTQSEHLLGRFSGHLEGVLFVYSDEATFGKDPRTTGAYKALTTEPTLLVEHKGQTPYTARNHMTFLITSNSLAAAPVETNDRRATVFDVSDVRRQDQQYFAALWNEWDTQDGRGAFIDFLLKRDLSAFDPTKPISTAAKAAMAAATADSVTAWWIDVLNIGHMSGALPDPNGNDADWSAGPITVPNNSLSAQFQTWCRDNRVRHPVSHDELLRRIGELCPSRTGTKPRINGKQVRAYTYPDLSTARAETNSALGGTVISAEDNET
jgi:hypothetical protein